MRDVAQKAQAAPKNVNKYEKEFKFLMADFKQMQERLVKLRAKSVDELKQQFGTYEAFLDTQE